MSDWNLCNVTMKAGPGASKGYESFVANSLKGELLQEITSNLDEDLKNEALAAFCDSVSAGHPIKECIAKVQNDVLVKVPNVRNKFNIKFVYDSQLIIEIGVNKFSNGNAQFYHKLGVAPKETPEKLRYKKECDKRRNVVQDVKQSGGFPNIRLKPQVTVDKSAPMMSGKVSLPEGGWGDAPQFDEYLPNPTNKQTVRARQGYTPTPTTGSNTREKRPRQLGDLFRNKKPQMNKLRTKSVGRPAERVVNEEGKNGARKRPERSISPSEAKLHGKGRGALGDVFLSGLKPSQNRLYRTPTVARKQPFRSGRDWSIDEVENDADERRRRISGSSLGGRISSWEEDGGKGSQQLRGSGDEEGDEEIQKHVRPPGWMDGRRKQDNSGWKSHKINVQVGQDSNDNMSSYHQSPKGPRVHIIEMSTSKPPSFDESDADEPFVTYDDDEDSFHEPVKSQPFQPNHSPVRSHTIRSPSPVQKITSQVQTESPSADIHSFSNHSSHSDFPTIQPLPELPAHHLSRPVKVLPLLCSQPIINVTIQQEPNLLRQQTITMHKSPITTHRILNVNHENHSETPPKAGWISIPIQRIA